MKLLHGLPSLHRLPNLYRHVGRTSVGRRADLGAGAMYLAEAGIIDSGEILFPWLGAPDRNSFRDAAPTLMADCPRVPPGASLTMIVCRVDIGTRVAGVVR